MTLDLQSKYAYAVGKIRVLETRLMNRTDVERMLGAEDAQSAYKVLNDLDYAKFIREDDKIEDFQKVIARGLLDLQKNVNSMVEEKNITQCFWLPYDFHNIKTLIRAKYNPISEEELEESFLVTLGNYSHNLFEKYIYEKNHKKDLPSEMVEIIDEAIELYAEEQNAFALDTFLDKKMLSYMLKLSKKSKEMKQSILHMIDSANIKIFFRCKEEVLHPQALESFVEGGSWTQEEFTQLLSGSFDKQKMLFGLSLYKSVFADIDETAWGNLTSYDADTLISKKDVQNTQKVRMASDGINTIIAYINEKNKNVRILRTILLGKINKFDQEKIRKKLEGLYK